MEEKAKDVFILKRLLSRLIWLIVFAFVIDGIITSPTIQEKIFLFVLAIPVFFGWTKGWRQASAELEERFPFGKRLLLCAIAVIVLLVVIVIVFRVQ